MMMPRLSGGVSRGTSMGRPRGGIRPSPEVTTYCRCSCADGTAACQGGAGTSLAQAEAKAHLNIETFCSAHGGMGNGTPSYSSTPC
jgi:hypothetical protein